MGNWPPDFIDTEDVIALHVDQIAKYGGSLGFRDLGLLESAVAQPSAGFGEQFLHDDVYAMAAAYLFHLTKNHPFIDGNKRVGLASAATFLDLNGIELNATEDELYQLTIDVATSVIGKPEIAAFFREHSREL